MSGAPPSGQAADRERLGRIVRETWVRWALEQPDPKPSWLIPWEELDDGQREVDMRIGEELAGSLTRERSALISEVAELRRTIRNIEEARELDREEGYG